MDYQSFLKVAYQLKAIRRTGWVQFNIDNPEHIADHCYGTALLALTIELPEGIERERLVHMALVHDLGEAVIGDIVVVAMSDKEKLNKDKLEKEALSNLLAAYPDLQSLALEYLHAKSPTALFCKELDKLDMAIQARIYEESGTKLTEFYGSALRGIHSTQVRRAFDEMKKA